MRDRLTGTTAARLLAHRFPGMTTATRRLRRAWARSPGADARIFPTVGGSASVAWYPPGQGPVAAQCLISGVSIHQPHQIRDGLNSAEPGSLDRIPRSGVQSARQARTSRSAA